MKLSRQGCWSGLPFPIPENHPDPGINPKFLFPPALAGGFFTTVPPGKPGMCISFMSIKPEKRESSGPHLFTHSPALVFTMCQALHLMLGGYSGNHTDRSLTRSKSCSILENRKEVSFTANGTFFVIRLLTSQWICREHQEIVSEFLAVCCVLIIGSTSSLSG